MDNHLSQEFREYQKEKQLITEVLREAEGKSNSQHKVIGFIFAFLIFAILMAGFVLHLLTLTQTLGLATLVAVLKVIWMFYDLQKSIHFEFWLLNSLEFRLNEMDRRIRNIEKIVTKKEEEK